jgi:hypothetical protein
MNQRLTINANDFINQVEKFSKHSLNRKAEMIVIYNAAADSNRMNTYRDLCFTAKYLLGIIRILQEGNNNPRVNTLDHVKKDFSTNMVKAIDLMRQIIANEDESQKQYFEEKFFAKSHSVLANLSELLADLEQVKLYLNYLKREKN